MLRSPAVQSVLRFVVRFRLLPHAPPMAAARTVFDYVRLRRRLRRARVRGWCPLCDGFVLFWLASFVPREGPIVEIGSAWGLSTIMLATAGGEVIAVDPYEGAAASRLEEFGPNLERFGVRHRVDGRRMRSHEAAEAYDGPPIGLLYVDGDHSYEGVAADIRDWLPHLRPGCMIAFHDFGAEFGVERAVREAVAQGTLERPTHFSGVATARRLPLASS